MSHMFYDTKAFMINKRVGGFDTAAVTSYNMCYMFAHATSMGACSTASIGRGGAFLKLRRPCVLISRRTSWEPPRRPADCRHTRPVLPTSRD